MKVVANNVPLWINWRYRGIVHKRVECTITMGDKEIVAKAVAKTHREKKPDGTIEQDKFNKIFGRHLSFTRVVKAATQAKPEIFTRKARKEIWDTYVSHVKKPFLKKVKDDIQGSGSKIQPAKEVKIVGKLPDHLSEPDGLRIALPN